VANPRIINCEFSNNLGSGFSNRSEDNGIASPVFTNCIFSGNGEVAVSNFAMKGGDCNPALNSCQFINNSKGAIRNIADGRNDDLPTNCNPRMTNCLFKTNSSTSGFFSTTGFFNSGYQGILYNEALSGGKCNPIATNCEFDNNTGLAIRNFAYSVGICSPSFYNCLITKSTDGAIVNESRDSKLEPFIKNCTIGGNSGIAIFNKDFNFNSFTSFKPTIVNTIIWGNQAEINGTGSFIKNSIVKGSKPNGVWNPAFGTDAGNNLDVDPLYIDPGNANFNLQPCSPGFDIGSNADNETQFDLAGNIRLVNNQIDLGA